MGEGVKKSNEVEPPAEKRWRAMLRNKNINYSRGVFFVTSQAAFNKSIFGAIVGERCVLNELGRAAHESLATLGERYAGVEVIEYVVMPNHIHALIRLAGGAEARHNGVDLGFVVGRFKSWVAKVYRDLKEAGRAVDVVPTPWQRDYWDKLVTTKERLEAIRRYIRENPRRWTRDRFGAVTAFTYGNVDLLNASLVGFVASQGAFTSELKPRLLWRKGASAEARRHEAGMEARHDEAGAEARQNDGEGEEKPPVISTFTSAQERAIFSKLVAAKRRFVRVYPGGIPPEGELPGEIVAASKEGRALLLSPVESGTGINKQRAIWCNEYILKNADEVWAGDITPGHTLASLVAALAPKSGMRASVPA